MVPEPEADEGLIEGEGDGEDEMRIWQAKMHRRGNLNADHVPQVQKQATAYQEWQSSKPAQVRFQDVQAELTEKRTEFAVQATKTNREPDFHVLEEKLGTNELDRSAASAVSVQKQIYKTGVHLLEKASHIQETNQNSSSGMQVQRSNHLTGGQTREQTRAMRALQGRATDVRDDISSSSEEYEEAGDESGDGSEGEIDPVLLAKLQLLSAVLIQRAYRSGM